MSAYGETTDGAMDCNSYRARPPTLTLDPIHVLTLDPGCYRLCPAAVDCCRLPTLRAHSSRTPTLLIRLARPPPACPPVCLSIAVPSMATAGKPGP